MADPNDPIQVLLQGLRPGTDAALNRAGYAPGVGAFVAPQKPMPQISPTAQYIQDMQALLRGGIGKLSTGEKLGAVGQILQAAGSRGAMDPGAVIQNVRQQQMQKLNAQLQIAQLQQKAEQERQKRAFIDQYADRVPEDLQNLLANSDVDTAFDIVKSRVAGNRQLFQILDGPEGKKVAVYSDPSGELITVETELPNKVDTQLVDQGVTKTLIDQATGETIAVFDVNDLTPARVARLNKPPAGRSGGGGRGGKLNKPQKVLVDGKPQDMQWNPATNSFVPFRQKGVALPARSAAPDVATRFQNILAPKSNQRMFGN